MTSPAKDTHSGDSLRGARQRVLKKECCILGGTLLLSSFEKILLIDLSLLNRENSNRSICQNLFLNPFSHLNEIKSHFKGLENAKDWKSKPTHSKGCSPCWGSGNDMHSYVRALHIGGVALRYTVEYIA